MIAICPTCHDAVHFGQLTISDDTLRTWKRLIRASARKRDLVYVEPSPSPRILIAGFTVVAKDEVVVMALAESRPLSFRIVNDEIVFVNLVIRDVDGVEVMRVRENHVTVEPGEGFRYASVPGRFELTATDVYRFLPPWALENVRAIEPAFAETEATVLSLHVVAPGTVRVAGIWADQTLGVVATDSYIHNLWPNLDRPISLRADPEGLELPCDGPIRGPMFGAAWNPA